MARAGFNYGVSEEKVLTSNVKVWKTEGDFTALVDADSIPYLVGFCSDPLHYLEAQRSGNFYEHPYWKRAIDHACTILNAWVMRANADSAILYVTDSASNFRLKIAKTKQYKGQRQSEKPPFFTELKQWLIDHHGALLSDGCEADDEISIETHKRMKALEAEGVELYSVEHKLQSGFCIISRDKDLNIIPTWHVDPDSGEKYWVDEIGELLPVWKEKVVKDYEQAPLFNGVPVPVSKCCYLSLIDGKIEPIPFSQHPLSHSLESKELRDTLWYYSETGLPEAQDSFVKGAKKGQGKFKRILKGDKTVEVINRLKGTGKKFFYSQLLTGDTSDNYAGLEGVGCSGAFKAINGLLTEEELHNKVYSMYQEVHRHKAMEMLTEQGQLAHMQTYAGELWLPYEK